MVSRFLLWPLLALVPLVSGCLDAAEQLVDAATEAANEACDTSESETSHLVIVLGEGESFSVPGPSVVTLAGTIEADVPAQARMVALDPYGRALWVLDLPWGTPKVHDEAVRINPPVGHYTVAMAARPAATMHLYVMIAACSF